MVDITPKNSWRADVCIRQDGASQKGENKTDAVSGIGSHDSSSHAGEGHEPRRARHSFESQRQSSTLTPLSDTVSSDSLKGEKSLGLNARNELSPAGRFAGCR